MIKKTILIILILFLLCGTVSAASTVSDTNIYASSNQYDLAPDSSYYDSGTIATGITHVSNRWVYATGLSASPNPAFLNEDVTFAVQGQQGAAVIQGTDKVKSGYAFTYETGVTGNSLIYAYTTIGTKTPQLTLQNPAGSYSGLSTPVTVGGIQSLTLTSPMESPQGAAITADVVAIGGDLTYQWYTSPEEILLTAIYCSDQTTYPFNQNGGITVKDDNNQYWRYNPTTNVKSSLSGSPSEKTWETVQKINYITSSGSTTSTALNNNYINTGIIMKDGYSNTLNFNVPSNAGKTVSLAGASVGDKSTLFSWWDNAVTTGDAFVFVYNNNQWLQISNSQKTGDFSVSVKGIGNNRFEIYSDSTLYSTVTLNAYPSNTYCLFADYRGSAPINYGTKSLYSATFTDDNGNKLREYQPIYYNGIYTMYDMVNHEILTTTASSSTGQYIAGSFTGGGTPTPLTFTGTDWQPITGQTSSQLSYTQAPLGDNYFKVVINEKVDSEQQGFQPLYVHVIPAKPTINSLTLLTTDEIPLGESLRAETNCTNYDGSPISYQWLYSTDNLTYTAISGQATYQLTYAPPTATLYYIKLIATDRWGSADSIEAGFLPLNTTVFNGIPTNTITSESHLMIWREHYGYYNDKSLTLGNDVTVTNTQSIPEFAGTFTGNDHTLINLRQPLITELSGTVKNLKFKDCLISATDYAGLVSATTQTATIENVDADNCNIYSTNSGGITGAVLGENTLIRNCNVNQCTVIGTAKSAGITPVTQADTAITNVHVTKSDITSPSGYAWGVSP